MSKKDNVIEFKDLKVPNFIAFIENANVGVSQVIDFEKDSVISRGHPEARTFAKLFQMMVSDLFTYGELPADFIRIKLALPKLKALRDNIEIFNKAGIETIDGFFQFEPTGEKGIYLAHFIKFNSKDNKLKIATNTGDANLISYMPSTAWAKFADVENTLARFDIDSKFIHQLAQLIKLDVSDVSDNAKSKEVSIALWVAPDGGIVFTSRNRAGARGEFKWSLEFPDDKNKVVKLEQSDLNSDGKLALCIPMRVVEAMKQDFYTVFVTFNKHTNYNTFVLKRNDSDIYISGILPYDPNKK